MAHKFLLIACFIIGASAHVFGQCEVTASISPGTSICGDCATLTAFGRGQGQQVFNENFNSGSPSGWAFTQQATFTNPCSPNGVDGTTHLWMGSASAVPRSLVTNPYNFTTAVSGATVCFDMLFAEQGDAAPCEGPDLPQEGVYLQYSTNGGSTWTTIHYFDPNGGNDPDLINWNNWCFPIPPAALGPNTQIRFFQDADSGAEYDHWGIDNVAIYYNDPTYNITWQHDNYSYGIGSSGGANPTKVCPQATTDYIVVMTNGVTTCRDTVSLTVSSPTIEIEAGNDTSICPSTCANLNATAKVVKHPEQILTFSDNTQKIIEPGTPAHLPINVTGLNNPTINPVVIQSVCVGSLSYAGAGFDLATLQFVTITVRHLRFELVCPDGTIIRLVAQNTMPAPGPNTVNNMCFVPAGPPLTTGSGSYTGSFGPNQPFSNFNGCSANGVWELRVTLTGAAFGFGYFDNWSITFLDPEISYPADFTWSPTTNMTGANTLTPQVCPPNTQIYTLTASDTAGCVTVTDNVTVTVQPCCNLNYTATSTNPTCSGSNGSININVTQGVGPYTYVWTDGPTGATRSNLPAGTYTVRITDNGQANCFRDTTIILTTTTNPVIDNITPTPELCAGDNDGSITVNANGGTGALTYAWTPANTGATINNLAPGNYTVTVTDASGCTVTGSTVLNAGPPCCTLAFTASGVNPTCGGTDGSITVAVTSGAGNYTYAWTGSTSTTNTATGLSAGTYSVTVTDITQGCDHDTTITLVTTTAPVINSITPTPEACLNDNDGTITVSASGGTGALTYAWTPANTGATINNLAPGNYTVTVTDASGCTVTGSTVLNPGPVCCNIVIAANSTNPTCGGTDGSITVTVTTGSGNYTYVWSGSTSTTNTASNLGSGTYGVTITDITQGCDHDTTINLSSSNAPTIDNITATNETCQGDGDGTATVTASGGTGALTYEWSTIPAQTTTTATGLVPGNYIVTVTDAAGCEAIGNINVAAGPNCCNLSYDIATTDPNCGATDGSVVISNLGGSGNYSFLWSNAAVTQDIIGVGAGTYSVTITDNAYPNCQLDTTVTLSNPNAPVIDNITATAETCLGDNDGTVDMTLSGGTPPYDIEWSNAEVTEDLANLAPGNYTVTITDDAGCQVTGFIVVPAGPNCCNISFDITVVDPTCGQSNGSLEVTNIVGTGPFDPLWNTGASTMAITNLAAGTYTVTVTDLGQPNCQLDSIITLSNPNAPVIDNIVATAETCLGDNDGTVDMTVSGGTPPYDIIWSNNEITEDLANLAPGNYTVTVTDDLGCAVTGFIVVPAGPQCCSVVASATSTPASCGGTDGVITVVADATSGTPPFEYRLDNGAYGSNSTFTVAGGNYTVDVRDANGCDTTLQVVVSEANNTIVLNTVGTDPSCPGSADGSAEAVATGGAAPLTVLWSNAETTDVISSLIAGVYNVTVTDQTNCRAFGTVTLTDPPPPVVSLGADWELCDGQDAGLDAGTASAYLWSTGDTTQTITATAGGTYNVTITNAGGCTATDEVLVNIAAPFTVDAGEDTTIIQYESFIELNGSVNGASGGAYLWTPTDFLDCDDCPTPSLSPDSTTTYVLTYTTALGCWASDSVTVTVLPGEYFAIVPNAFSPNGDRANDILYVYHAGVKKLVFRIHNRWGEKVFETDDMNRGWDGTLKGVAAQDGVYVWDLYVEFLNTKIPAQRKKGSVLLLK